MDPKGRRRFLISAVGGILTITAGALIYPVISYLSPRKSEDKKGKVSLPVAEIPPGSAKFFDFRGETGVVVHRKVEGFIALSAVCTHLGCIVQWEKEKQDFLCPCHAGRYSADGAVISGPPPRPLARLSFTVSDGTIMVD